MMAATGPPNQWNLPLQTQGLEDEFQSVLCEGCQKESPNLKLLTCLHTLCLNCLSEKKPAGQCPVCQTAIPKASSIPGMDNKLFTNLQARLSTYKKIINKADLFCDNCKKEAEFWCCECKEFLCTQCFEAHQRYLKKDNHEAKRVAVIRAGSASDFLEGTRKANNFFCSKATHKNETSSVYCKKCCKAMCCVCTVLDIKHAGQHCDIGLEIRQRQDKLAALSQVLKEKRSDFVVTHNGLQAKAAHLEQVRSKTRQEIQQRVEELMQLLRREEEELLMLVEKRWEQGCRVLAGELQYLDNVLRRMEAGERLVQKMRLYGTDQEVMDMQPFIKASLEELQRLQPPTVGSLAQPDRHFAECQARLQLLVERVIGHTGAASAQARENFHPIAASIAPARKRNVQTADVLPPQGKVMKLEGKDIQQTKSEVPQRQSNLDQPGTSSQVPAVTHTTGEDSLLDAMDNCGDGLPESDNDILGMSSGEEDSSDTESLDSILLDEPNCMPDEGTNPLSIAIVNESVLVSRQESLLFFDVKISKSKIIQLVVVDKEKLFLIKINLEEYLSTSIEKKYVCQPSWRSLISHLKRVNKPILAGFGLWSLPFPTLLKALAAMDKEREFSNAVYGFLDILPLIKEKIPGRDNYKLKTLANIYLPRQLTDGNITENAKVMQSLCEVLGIIPLTEPRLIFTYANLECFISLEPLLAEKLLTKPSAQTLAAHGVGLSQLLSVYKLDPIKGLQNVCRLVNAKRHSSEKRVRNLSKSKVFFQRQLKPAECQTNPADSDLLKRVKTEKNC